MHFTTNLPKTAPRSGAAASPPKVLRVLYADDVKELRDVIRLTLMREGHTVDCVVNGSEALKQLQAAPDGYDLLITDHHMPVMNGLELVTAVRALPGYHGRIMVFTSELSLHIAAAYRRLGVDQMIPKPVFPSVLRQMIAALFAD
ncbi:MAG TPA: response regulator [Opitutaceae bacterium]